MHSIPLFKTHFSTGKSIIHASEYDDAWDDTKPDNLANIAVEYGLKKIFLVEDRMAACIPAFKSLKAKGIGLVFGLRMNFISDVTVAGLEGVHKNIIFCRNEAGYKRLIAINNKAGVDFFDEEPRMDYKTLHEMWSDDLVLAVPFYDSFIHKNLLSMEQAIPDFRGLNPVFFVEDNLLPYDQCIQAGIEKYGPGRTLGVKSIFYRSRKDHLAWLARKLMERGGSFGGGTIEKPEKRGLGSKEFCMESWAELGAEESDFEKSFEPLSLTLPGIRLPEIEISQERRDEYGIKPGMDNSEILAQICRVGFQKKKELGILAPGREQDYGDRMRRELDVLKRTHFTDYILLVWDFMEIVNKRGLPRGLARGSAGGGLVNYLTGITDIDPIEHNLLFERFISEARAKTNTVDGVNFLGNAPDIDVDLGREARKQVIEYVESRHPGRFCKLSTSNTLTSKSVVKEVLKIMLMKSEDDAKEISDQVEAHFGKNDSSAKTYEKSKKFRSFFEEHPREWAIVNKLEGCIKSVGVHASAYLVSYYPLDEIMPLERAKDGERCAVYDMHTSESLVIKIDLLGLDTVDLVDSVLKMIGKDPKSIDCNDPVIYEPLQDLRAGFGLFQISGDAALRGLNKIQPTNVTMLSDVLAICRPGAFAFIDQYADFVHGRREKPEIHPLFSEILDSRAGLCLYQEDLMQMAVKLGFSLVEADTLRRIVGKKKKSEIAAWEEKVKEKVKENGLDPEAGKVFFDIANASADYSFNFCCGLNTLVQTSYGAKKMSEVVVGEKILAYDTATGKDHFVTVVNIYSQRAILWDFVTESGEEITCSMEHKFLCEDGEMRPIKEVLLEQFSIVRSKGDSARVFSCALNSSTDSLDFEVDHPDHNFYANGLVVSNSHSQAYAVLTAISVYCKFQYPKEFFLSALNLYSGDQEKIAQIAQELPQFGLSLLPPDIAKSGIDFEIEGDAIRFGIGSIKGISTAALIGLQQFIREGFCNLFSIFQAAKQNKLNQTVVIGLICSGCLDAYTSSRPAAVMQYQIFNKLTPREVTYLLENGEKYKYNIVTALKDFLNWIGANGKKFGTEKRLETIRRDCAPYISLYTKNADSPDVAEYYYEKALLGFSYSHTLSSLFTKYPDLSSATEIRDNRGEKEYIEFVGEVKEVRVTTSKKGDKYCKMVLVDETGDLTVMFYGDKWLRYVDAQKPTPEEGQIIYIQGQKGADITWVNKMSIQHFDVFMRVSELKKFQARMEKEGLEAAVEI